MKNNLFLIKSIGLLTTKLNVNGEKCPVREMRIREVGRGRYNEFIGTLWGADAIMDLSRNDLISTEMFFYTCEKQRKEQQLVSFHNIKKVKV